MLKAYKVITRQLWREVLFYSLISGTTGKKKCVKLLTVSKLITILKAKIRYISVLPKKKNTTATIIHFDFCVEN